MKPSEDPEVLEAVTGFRAARAASLTATLEAARARRTGRRRRRILLSASGILGLVIVAITWMRPGPEGPGRVVAPQDGVIRPGGRGTGTLVRSAEPVVERVRTPPALLQDVLVPSSEENARLVEVISDQELLEIAGGKSVGLARMHDGRIALLIAGAGRPVGWDPTADGPGP